MADEVLFYNDKGPFFEFSNYYPRKIVVDGEVFSSSEHAYQYAKYVHLESSEMDLEYGKRIQEQSTPNKARYVANRKKSTQWPWMTSLNKIIDKYNVSPREDFDDVKVNIMRRIVFQKFYQHPDLQDKLRRTGEADIIENSPRDSFWGNGRDKKGSNHLGRILIETRGLLFGPKDPPTKCSNWIIQDALLAAQDPAENKPCLSYLKDALLSTPVEGKPYLKYLQEIDVFVSLLERKEVIGPTMHPYISGETIGTYRVGEFDFEIIDHDGREILFLNFPIEDMNVTDDESVTNLVVALIQLLSDKKILVHCHMGKGRTGTITSTLLGLLYQITASEAIEISRKSFLTRKINDIYNGDSKGLPHRPIQVRQVNRIIKGVRVEF